MRTKDDKIRVIDWVVDKAYHRKGIGLKLYRKLMRHVKGKKLVTFVDIKNLPSLAGHKKLGFEPMKKLKDPYGLGIKQQVWLMEKS